MATSAATSTTVRAKEFHFPVRVEWLGERRVAARVAGKPALEVAPPPVFRITGTKGELTIEGKTGKVYRIEQDDAARLRVRLEDGSYLRLNYDAQNGQPYTPVGRLMIDAGLCTPEEMSMDRIRAWAWSDRTTTT